MLHSFDYATVRVVPRVEREEFVNAGVILFSRTLGYLGARAALPAERLAALDPGADAEEIGRYLALIPLICAGGDDAGPIGRIAQAERFHWLVSPSSAVVQPSPVHSGLCTDPAAMLDHLFDAVVHAR